MMVCCVSRFACVACAPIVEIYDFARARGEKRRTQRVRDLSCFAEAGRRIEIRRHENEGAIDILERGCEGRDVIYIRAHQLAATIRPCFALAYLAGYSADGLMRGQQVASYLAAYLARDSGDCKHRASFEPCCP